MSQQPDYHVMTLAIQEVCLIIKGSDNQAQEDKYHINLYLSEIFIAYRAARCIIEIIDECNELYRTTPPESLLSVRRAWLGV